ncbi:ribonuclease E inhibitor RraB [Sphingopyxis sp.]|jgi:hypothetical protein|uniref:ribonuclease E inhibitor RraB n=1 Tax=Sphingopyxis sp. TaxID=1908224 RepID=UPI0025E0E594|nr:ribonuclease E inhibitor RraB [Sphingopyxis sp.]MBK6414496.1 ribonuclease E inhibitor RraB [Sphingopyxis sp.]
MFSIVATLGILLMDLDHVPIAAERLAKEEASDAQLVDALKQAGDVATVVRTISAYFVGKDGPIKDLKGDVDALGWRLVSVSGPEQDGSFYLWLEREQSTSLEDLARLRSDALKIEAHYEVKYDGWETSAEPGIN